MKRKSKKKTNMESIDIDKVTENIVEKAKKILKPKKIGFSDETKKQEILEVFPRNNEEKKDLEKIEIKVNDMGENDLGTKDEVEPIKEVETIEKIELIKHIEIKTVELVFVKVKPKEVKRLMNIGVSIPHLKLKNTITNLYKIPHPTGA